MILIYLPVLLSIVGCSSSGGNGGNNTGAITIYNQAYQENFLADSIAEIEANA